MFGLILRRKSLFLIFLFTTIIVLIKVIFWLDPRTKVVFCDVGQGDASYIRVKNKVDILVDAGPDKKVLSCLGKYMPFWDRKIELAILSHPQKDHFGGFFYVFDRYRVDKFFLPPVNNPSSSFQSLIKKIKNKKTSLKTVWAGNELIILNNRIVFLWPTDNFIRKNVVFETSPITKKQKLDVLGTTTVDLNHLSLIFVFQEKNFNILYSGDASPLALNSLISQYKSDLGLFHHLNILKVPHHGSKNGLTENFLRLAEPQISVISVSKNNSYGHPAKEILEMLKAAKTKIRRTDKEGNIVFRINNN